MSRFFILHLHHHIVVTVCFQMSRVVLMLKIIEIMTRDMYIPAITYHRTRYVIAGIYYWKIYMDLYFCKQGLFFCVITHFFTLALFKMGVFGAAHGWGGGPLPKIRHTYPIMMKLGIVISYLRKIQKMYKSRDTSLEFC